MGQKVHITLLGKEPLPVFYLIQKFKLKDIYVLGTKENKSVYARLERVCKYLGCSTGFVEVLAYDIKDVMTKCESIHKRYSDNDEFVYNLTGGTKPMAIGAYIIAKRYKSEIYYTDSKSCLNLDTFESLPMDEQLENKIIFILQGQQLKKYDVWNESEESDNIAASQQISRFIKDDRKIYDKLREKYAACNGIFNKYKFDSVEYEFFDKELTITRNNKTVLSINTLSSKQLLFEGRWWECLVADAMARWSQGKYEIWTDVVFDVVDNPSIKKDKNEVDVLINIGNTIVFVECKSGKLTQNEVYKMDAIKKTYGSEKSKSILVSLWPISEDLKQKATDLQISVIAPNFVREDILAKIPGEMDKIMKRLTL